ncbi:alpha/beta hydrolase family esterase [Vibrio sp.]|uniref:alpha/beta hydrolase family esterase n=1 Tax=Vibrio sp. TaxID=678 RepID=UPI003D0D1FFA
MSGSRWYAVALLFSCLLSMLWGSGLALAAESAGANRLQHYTLNLAGQQRSYYLHRPREIASKPALLLVLHGGGRGDGLSPAKYFGFNALADLNQFIVAYPNGMDNFWRDGRGYTHRGTVDDSIDDVQFITELIEQLTNQYQLDTTRIYLAGISNGGMMTLRLGCELSNKLAAIAVIAASLPENLAKTCQPKRAVPLLIMNGTEDPLVPYTGGAVKFFRKRMGTVIATEQTIALWREFHGCSSDSQMQWLANPDQNDHSRVQMTRYDQPQKPCDVVLYSVLGGGHTLPGSQVPDLPRIIGHKNGDINGAQVIWHFLQQYPR